MPGLSGPVGELGQGEPRRRLRLAGLVVSMVAEKLTASHHADNQGGGSDCGGRQYEPRRRPPADGGRRGLGVLGRAGRGALGDLREQPLGAGGFRGRELCAWLRVETAQQGVDVVHE